MINWFGIVQETLMITSFVVIVMLLIEFFNVLSHGKLVKTISKRPAFQILTGTLLGLIPGCMGTFTAVSLYTHRLFTFGALIAAMIATAGDEAYFMLALMPEKALLMFAIMAVLAIATGFLIDKFFKIKNYAADKEFSFDIHDHDCCEKPQSNFSIKNFNFGAKRILIISIILSIVTLTLTGIIGHTHSDKLIFSLPTADGNQKVEMSDVQQNREAHNHDVHEHNHGNCSHENSESAHNHEHGFDWVKFTILISSLFALIVLIFTNDHFIKTHIWSHLIKKHLPKILFWVFITLLGINIILQYAEFGNWIYNNLYIVLLIAVLIGIITQSGLHLVFVVLFLQ
ncbi:MAG: putative manganese transporter [Bacteroidales bacterium]|nr:putative manganese transporter [Bacteroidales bacterium]